MCARECARVSAGGLRTRSSSAQSSGLWIGWRVVERTRTRCIKGAGIKQKSAGPVQRVRFD